jgi:hypothetical protein
MCGALGLVDVAVPPLHGVARLLKLINLCLIGIDRTQKS